MQDEAKNDPGAAWMLAWQAGDEQAFERLVEAYSGQVYALLTRFLGPHASREDLVQEVFLRLIRARDKYQASARFTTWLYRIVFNMSVNESERSARRRHLSLDQPAPGSEADSAPGEAFGGLVDRSADDPAQAMQRGDAVEAVRAAIASLPDAQRMALVLAKYEELPYSEIGAIMGSSDKAIKSLIHRARETLRARLEPFLAGELA